MGHPQHIALIMDGNRRWARMQGINALYSDASVQAVFNAIEFCREQNVLELTLYAFSLENFKNRDVSLQEQVWAVLQQACTERTQWFIEQGVCVRFVGKRELFPTKIAAQINDLEQATVHGQRLQLNVLFFYGAQQEIAHATQLIAQKVAAGKLSSDQITPELIARHLWTAPSTFPDLVIRTGGATRLSNFLLFQAAYSEWQFLDCYWPELTKEILMECVEKFCQTRRNFGK